jgi:hypothetical protein
MNKGIRITPPVCLIISLAELLCGRLRFPGNYLNSEIQGNDGKTFRIFRDIRKNPIGEESGNCVFVVRFRFAHLSQCSNRLASVIPMLIIAGFPGFMQKIYAEDAESGFWQGMYQWRSQNDLEAYQKSFIFHMMNKRAVSGSLTSFRFCNTCLTSYLQDQKEIQNQNKKSKKIKS